MTCTTPRKVRIALERGRCAGESMRAVLAELLWTARYNAAGVAAGADPEFLHQLRVSIRGTRAMIPRALELYETDLLVQLRELLQWSSAATSHARDLDVLSASLPEYAKALPADVIPHVRPLQRHAALRARQSTLEVSELVAGARFHETLAIWEEVVTPPFRERPMAARPARKVARDWVRRRHRAVWKAASVVSASSDLKDLHRLRLKLKKLRYQLDFFAALFPPKASDPLREVVRTGQDVLGTLNDTAAHEQLIGTLAGDLLRYRLASTPTLLVAGQVQAHLQQVRIQQRRRFKAWRKAFLATRKHVIRAF